MELFPATNEEQWKLIKSVIDEMDDKTFGAVFERRNATLRDRDRYVAVIDCRGKKY